MRTNHSRIAAVVAALAAGGLALFALKPTSAPPATLAARNPAVEVRTQVIRRTIHVIRHEPGAGLGTSRSSSVVVTGGHGSARTGSSGAHGATSSVGVGGVATRTSGSHATTIGAGGPVSTRTSGSHGSGTSGAPVTRTSGGGHSGDGGDGRHDN
jgi:hypothetical protein